MGNSTGDYRDIAESLQTQRDNLKWEVNRLGAENRRLRDEDLDVSSRLDLETELQQSNTNTAQLPGATRGAAGGGTHSGIDAEKQITGAGRYTLSTSRSNRGTGTKLCNGGRTGGPVDSKGNTDGQTNERVEG